MKKKTRRIIVLIELENGNVHQVVMTQAQQNAIKALFKATDTLQVTASPINLKVDD